MRNYFLFFVLSFLLFSCAKKPKYIVNVNNVSVDFKIKRFDVDFYQSKIEDLPLLKKEYPLLFPELTPDSVWVSKINDKEEQELFSETQKKYKSIEKIKDDLKNLFQHVVYYNPNFKVPNVITVLSNLDYDYRTIYLDSLVVISLDLYLGKQHDFYGDYPDYIKQNNEEKRIVVDVASNMIEKQVKSTFNRTFLGKMIAEGKKMYLLDMYLPLVKDAVKIGYSPEKLSWAISNEESIWQYFIEKNLLYSTDTKLNKRFLDVTPFSKFYLEHDRDSPGRIGQWLGWQIVRSYMDKNDVSLQTLIEIDEEELFKKSKYKPRK